MDQHPIPQNVTGFQFKLVGKMTVKQFGYVALGVIAAVIVYYLPLKGILGVLLKTILLPLFGASGAIIAFVPIDGRPIDVMAGNFLKAIFAPNQYVYKKTRVELSFSKIKPSQPLKSAASHQGAKSAHPQSLQNNKAQELQKILTKSYAARPKTPQDEKEAAFLLAFSQPLLPPSPSLSISPAHPTLPAAPPAPAQGSTKPPENSKNTNASDVLAEKESALEKEIDVAKKAESHESNQQEAQLLHQKTALLEKQLAEIHAQKQNLEEEIVKLKNQLVIQKTPSPKITQPPKSEPVKEKAVPHVRSIPKDMNKKMGLLVSDTPNVVSGVVKDPRGNVLPNILVEIKDKADNPVRAFKTNALGNFASATPLGAGEYVITLEDPKKLNTFDEIKIALTNQILLPLEIISYDKREALRKELFS
jgi:hypothetical protein